MTRLPTPGGDSGQWGQILNDFLSVEHNVDGTLKKAGAIAQAQADATAAQSTANAAIPASQKGTGNGVASLDSGSKLNIGQIPSSVIIKSASSSDIGKAIDAYTGAPMVVSGINSVAQSPTLHTFGHSVGLGNALSNTAATRAANRRTGKLAARLGATEINVAASGSRMMADANASPGQTAWVQQVFQNSTVSPTRSKHPYNMSPIVTAAVVWGINDIAEWGPVNATFLTAWKATLAAVIDRLRIGAVFENTHASVSYDGSWTSGSNVAFGSGSGSRHSTATNGAQLTISVPSGFEGGTVVIGLMTGATTGIAKNTSTMVATVDGTPRAGVSTVNCWVASEVEPYTYRIEGLAAGAHTIVLTFTAIDGGVIFDWWGIEAEPTPAVLVCDTIRATTYGYNSYTTTHKPTDADVNALNAANREVAARYTDGRVVTDDADAVIGGNIAYLNLFMPDGTTRDELHPNERGEAIAAQLGYNKLAPLLTTESVSQLGTLFG